MQEPYQEWSTLNVLHSLVSSWHYPQISDSAGKACQGQTLQLITIIHKLRTQKSLKHWALSNVYSMITDILLSTPLGCRTSQACRVLPVDGALPVRDQSGHVGRHQTPPGADVKKLLTAVIYESL
jgi:hypothetical protein